MTRSKRKSRQSRTPRTGTRTCTAIPSTPANEQQIPKEPSTSPLENEQVEREVDYKKIDHLRIEMQEDTCIGQTRLDPEVYKDLILERHTLFSREEIVGQKIQIQPQPQACSEDIRASLNESLAPSSASSIYAGAQEQVQSWGSTPTVFSPSPSTNSPPPLSIASFFDQDVPSGSSVSDIIPADPSSLRQNLEPEAPQQPPRDK
ncbi:hypothetical protein I302_102666 [Kwoniella bestiolae CBS 10118]|uniref:Uncharacterized protein n=1 Tax=Kwoniella bestiolae CBS 10118 TaxID=1296100 RepID=A0A1B9GFM2_9TREE|nr:hypothetical protein I302_01360 [Kwoniella bestiolae CBS 10118]OCF29847.1 hypothetical protein I302_01360 [Kwoniella bestiolae CBS 10118]